ncbi:MAG: AmmeMemoRadiSam system protein B [Gammaproteobacteria bacterium]
MNHVRPAAVAGTFYPAEREQLAHDVMSFLNRASEIPGEGTPPPKALIVPHAGYVYSGLTAAYAYKLLKTISDRVTRVVLLGPVHRVPVSGLALPTAKAFQTPFGQIMIDPEAVESIADLPQIVFSDAPHQHEHSLEVQLPFMQSVLDNFTLVPLAVGDASAAQVAEVIERLWGEEETLIVVSSDLSHFHTYDDAIAIDHQTVERILDIDNTITHNQACGGTPVNGLLLAAKKHGLRPRLLDYRNSGDTAGDKKRVVGYASFSFASAHNDRQ